MATPPGAQQAIRRIAPEAEQRHPRLDVLARSQREGSPRLVVGFVEGGNRCILSYVQNEDELAGIACGPKAGSSQLLVQRGINLESTQPEYLGGVAPANAVRVTLSSDDGETLEIPTFDAGARWGHTAFMAEWPAAPRTLVRAFGRNGQALAEKWVEGLPMAQATR